MSGFSPSIEELRDAVDADLRRFLAAKRSLAHQGDLLVDEIARLIEAGGKRLRPAFCYWGYRAGGGADDERIISAAASLELLHTFAIVHDDIMDFASERRGAPTAAAKHGDAVALLVGDLALVLADDLFMGSGYAPDRIAEAFKAYSSMRQRVIFGQYLDLVTSGDPMVDEETARLVARLKSGQYTVEMPLLIGACLAGAPQVISDGLVRFGAPLGEAFQLRDDLLGTFGERTDLGKPVDSDIREGKRNLLYAKTLALVDDSQKRYLIERWGRGAELSDEDVTELRELVESCGARVATEELLGDLRDEALEALETLDIEEEARKALRDLARLTTVRLR